MAFFDNMPIVPYPPELQAEVDAALQRYKERVGCYPISNAHNPRPIYQVFVEFKDGTIRQAFCAEFSNSVAGPFEWIEKTIKKEKKLVSSVKVFRQGDLSDFWDADEEDV